MKIITSKYREPIVLTLLKGRFSTQRNFLPGEVIEVDDSAISPECLILERKNVIEIVDKPDPPVIDFPDELESHEEVVTSEEEMSPEEVARLEEELLGSSDTAEEDYR